MSNDRDPKVSTEPPKADAETLKTSEEAPAFSLKALQVFEETLITEETFCRLMQKLAAAVQSVLDSSDIKLKGKDRDFLTKFAENAKSLSTSPLLPEGKLEDYFRTIFSEDKSIIRKPKFDEALITLEANYASPEFNTYIQSMGDSVRNYEKTMERFSKMKDKYKNFDALMNEALKEKKDLTKPIENQVTPTDSVIQGDLGLNDYLILPVQRAPRYKLLSVGVAENYVDNIAAQSILNHADKYADLMNKKLQQAYYELPAAMKHVDLLKDINALIHKTNENYAKRGVRPIEKLPLKEKMEDFITSNKNDVMKKMRGIKPNTSQYQQLSINEKLLFAAIAKKAKFIGNKKKTAKYESLIDKLTNVVILEEKESNIRKMQNVFKEMSAYIDKQMKEGNIIESELTKINYRKQTHKIEKSYAEELKTIKKEIDTEEVKLSKSNFIKKSLKTFKLLKKNESAVPEYATKPFMLPPEGLLPNAPKDDVLPPIPTGAPPPLPEGIVRETQQEMAMQHVQEPEARKKPVPSIHMSTAHVIDVINHQNVHAEKNQKQEKQLIKETKKVEQPAALASPRLKATKASPMQFWNRPVTNANEPKQKQPDTEIKKIKHTIK